MLTQPVGGPLTIQHKIDAECDHQDTTEHNSEDIEQERLNVANHDEQLADQPLARHLQRTCRKTNALQKRFEVVDHVWEGALELLSDLHELDHGRKDNEVEQYQQASQDANIDERHGDNPGKKALQETNQWMDGIGHEHGNQQKCQGTADLAEPPEDHPTHRQPHQQCQADDQSPQPETHCPFLAPA